MMVPLQPVRRIRSIRPNQRIRAIAEHSWLTTLLLVIAAAVAVAWASSPGHETYEELSHGLHAPVNEGLMSFFFLVVGVHIHRELTVGSLKGWKKALLPIVGAVGGMVVPALVYLSVAGGGEAASGWAIPTATDIAFAAALVRLAGAKGPEGLLAFVLALAVADDIGAILIVAVAYGGTPGLPGLLVAAGVTGAGFFLRWKGFGSPWIYALVGAGVWYGLFLAGLHPALSGIVVALLLPEELAELVEEHIGPWAEAVVLPLFALVNAGIALSGEQLARAAGSRVTIGIALGLVLGKAVGVTGAGLLAVRLGWGRLPEGVGPRHLLAGSLLCGVGFTVSLVIADLAFPRGVLREDAIAGIFAGSLVAAAAGVAVLSLVSRRGAMQG